MVVTLVMKQSNNLQALNKDLAFNQALLSLSKVGECKMVLIPYLQSKLHNRWLDPRECKSDKDFKTKYNLAFAFAQVSQEMIDLLSEEVLTAKIKDILAEIEREKLLDNSSYTLEGVEYGKK